MSDRLNELEKETLTFWCETAVALGFPKTIGETFGLIFISELPLSADDIVNYLGVSRSGAGQAMKRLIEIGAIRPATGLQSRKEHFELQTDLGVLLRRFLNSNVIPKINEFNIKREALTAQATETQSHLLTSRFEKLNRWKSKTDPILTILKSLANS